MFHACSLVVHISIKLNILYKNCCSWHQVYQCHIERGVVPEYYQFSLNQNEFKSGKNQFWFEKKKICFKSDDFLWFFYLGEKKKWISLCKCSFHSKMSFWLNVNRFRHRLFTFFRHRLFYLPSLSLSTQLNVQHVHCCTPQNWELRQLYMNQPFQLTTTIVHAHCQLTSMFFLIFEFWPFCYLSLSF